MMNLAALFSLLLALPAFAQNSGTFVELCNRMPKEGVQDSSPSQIQTSEILELNKSQAKDATAFEKKLTDACLLNGENSDAVAKKSMVFEAGTTFSTFRVHCEKEKEKPVFIQSFEIQKDGKKVGQLNLRCKATQKISEVRDQFVKLGFSDFNLTDVPYLESAERETASDRNTMSRFGGM